MHRVLDRLRENIRSVYFGNPAAVDRLVVCLLARGHVLIEDVPGVGKTLLATSLARSLDCRLSRIQFTPDMLPSDVLGVSVFNRDTNEFDLKRGPIFANIVLADEINRTTPRTQAAMLEAMNEASVSLEGRVIPLEQPFMVIATQNPMEFEGAYPLPESQLDRFLMRIHLGYPTPEEEAHVIEARPGLAVGDGSVNGTTSRLGAIQHLKPVATSAEVLELQRAVDHVKLERSLVDYIVRIAGATREHPEIEVGVSTRGALALAQAARATALLEGRDYCIPEDVSANVVAVCAHRVRLSGFTLRGKADAAAALVQRVAESVDAPV
ncbi:MAG: AAA family ATPase [Phycisphaerales bacterium]